MQSPWVPMACPCSVPPPSHRGRIGKEWKLWRSQLSSEQTTQTVPGSCAPGDADGTQQLASLGAATRTDQMVPCGEINLTLKPTKIFKMGWKDGSGVEIHMDTLLFQGLKFASQHPAGGVSHLPVIPAPDLMPLASTDRQTDRCTQRSKHNKN